MAYFERVNFSMDTISVLYIFFIIFNIILLGLSIMRNRNRNKLILNKVILNKHILRLLFTFGILIWFIYNDGMSFIHF